MIVLFVWTISRQIVHLNSLTRRLNLAMVLYSIRNKSPMQQQQQHRGI